MTLAASLLTLWRVRYLGFFSDDWVLLSKMSWSASSFVDAVSVNRGTRPMYGLTYWTLNLVASGDPGRWQIISSLTVILSGVVAFRLFKVLVRTTGVGILATTFGCAAGVLMLVFSPWTTALFAWPTGVLTLWSFVYVGEGLTWILTFGGTKRVVGVCLLLIGFLTYEAYWMLPLPLIFILWGRLAVRDSIGVFLAYFVAFALAIGYQRILVPQLGFGSPKPLSFDSSLAVKSIEAVPIEFMSALRPISWWIVLLGVGGLVLTLLVGRGIGPSILLRTLGLVALGTVMGAVQYASVGYPLSSNGVMSRTLALPVFFASLAFAIVVAHVPEIRTGDRHRRMLRVAGHGFVTLLLGVVSVSFMSRLADWTHRYRVSIQVLNALTLELNEVDIMRPDSSTISVVVQVDGDAAGDVFGAAWELSGAVGWREPPLVPDGTVSFPTAREGAWRTVWTGEEVVQSWCHGSPESVVSQSASVLRPLYIRIEPATGVVERGHLEAMHYFGCGGVRPTLAASER